VSEPLFATDWVHAFEEDGPEGEVYRPDNGERPLSRRPRERLSFSRDGSARLVVSGPDDRLQSIAARWTESPGEITVTADSPSAFVPRLRVRLQAPDRLLVRR
jgi:hypothetical protein